MESAPVFLCHANARAGSVCRQGPPVFLCHANQFYHVFLSLELGFHQNTCISPQKFSPALRAGENHHFTWKILVFTKFPKYMYFTPFFSPALRAGANP